MSEQRRFDLFQFLRDQWGPEPAGLLMELLPPVGLPELATKGDLAALEARLTGEIAATRGDVGALEARLAREIAATRGDMAALEGSLKVEIAATRGDVGALEARLTGEIAATRGDMAALEGSLKVEIASEVGGLRGEMHDGFGQVYQRMADMTRTFTLATVSSVVGGVGLAFAAARFA